MSEEYKSIDFNTVKKNKYGFVLMDLWSGHACIRAGRCVNELTSQIVKLLFHVVQDENAYVIVCVNDKLDAWKTKQYGIENLILKGAVEDELAESDYAAGLRNLFYRGTYDPDKRMMRYAASPYLEMEIVDECSCRPEEHREMPEGMNGILYPLLQDKKLRNRLVFTENDMHAVQYVKENEIKTVFYMGVHTNMCFLSRKNSILKMMKYGIETYIVKDLTDSRISRHHYPYMEHFDATDWFIEEIQNRNFISVDGKYMNCRAVNSTFFDESGKKGLFRFKRDRRVWRDSDHSVQITDSDEFEFIKYKDKYNENGRYGFPSGIVYEQRGGNILDFRFIYNNDRSFDKTKKFKPIPAGKVIVGVEIYRHETETENPVCGIKFLLDGSKYVSIGRCKGDSKKILFNKEDAYGNDTYALYTADYVKNRVTEKILNIEFYTTVYNLMTDGVKTMHFVDCTIYTGGNVYIDGYFYFFEGNFYVFLKDGKFLGRSSSLLLPGRSSEELLELSAKELSDTYFRDTYFVYGGPGSGKKERGIKWEAKKDVPIEINEENKEIYAEGISVLIEAAGDDNDGIKISLNEERMLPDEIKKKKFTAFIWGAGDYTIYGGKNGKKASNTHIKMKSGRVKAIYGGSKGANVTGDTLIEISGKSKVESVYGGGRGGKTAGRKQLIVGDDAKIGEKKGSGIAVGDDVGIDIVFTYEKIGEGCKLVFQGSEAIGEERILIPKLPEGFIDSNAHIFGGENKYYKLSIEAKEEQSGDKMLVARSADGKKGKLTLSIQSELEEGVWEISVVLKKEKAQERGVEGTLQLWEKGAARYLDSRKVSDSDFRADSAKEKFSMGVHLDQSKQREIMVVFEPERDCRFARVEKIHDLYQQARAVRMAMKYLRLGQEQ